MKFKVMSLDEADQNITSKIQKSAHKKRPNDDQQDILFEHYEEITAYDCQILQREAVLRR